MQGTDLQRSPSSDLQILAKILALDLDYERSREEIVEASRPFDWFALKSLAFRHRVAPLLSRRLAGLQCPSVPGDVVAELAAADRQNLLQVLGQQRELALLLKALDGIAVRPLLLKGLAVEQLFYQATGERDARDIDLMVGVDEIASALDCLRAQGYHVTLPAELRNAKDFARFINIFHHATLHSPHSGNEIELHWRFSNQIRMDLAFHTRLGGYQTLHFAKDLPITTYAPAAQLLYLSIHGATHSWARLKWLLDIDRCLRVLSGDQLRDVHEVARREQVERPLITSMALANRLFGTPLPSGYTATPNINRTIAHQISHCLRALDRPEVYWIKTDLAFDLDQLRYRLGIKRNIRHKLSILAKAILGPSDWISLAPQIWQWPIYPIQRALRFLRRRI